MKGLLDRRIVIFGRSIPLALIAAVVLISGVAVAAFLLVAQSRLTGTAVTAPLGNWDPGQIFCTVTGIGSCTPSATSLTLTGALNNVDDDSIIDLKGEWISDHSNSEAICITAINVLDPNVGAMITEGGTGPGSDNPTGYAPGYSDHINFRFDLSNITPGYDFGANGTGVDLEWQLFSVVQVGGECP